MTDEIQDWAKIAAYREACPDCDWFEDERILQDWDMYSRAVHALARRIQRDDKPPVDPLLLEARELAGIFWRSQGHLLNAINAESGNHDDLSVQAAYKYLKEKQNG